MKVETDPAKMKRMEAEARRLIGTLRPNTRHVYFSAISIVVTFFMGIAVAKSFIEHQAARSFADGLAIIVLVGFMFAFSRFAHLNSAKLLFDKTGIKTTKWGFGSLRSYDWNELIACEDIFMGIAYETADGRTIKTTSGGDFDNTLYTAYAIFKNRYSLED